MSRTDLAPTATQRSAAGRSYDALPVWMRLAARDLKAGIGDFAVFIGCIALGVMAITAVGALSDGLRGGLARQGMELLGGDISFVRPHARASEAERARLATIGRLSETASLRTMARRVDPRADQSAQALAEVKGVDSRYPLAGAVILEGGANFAAALSGAGAVVDPLLLEKMGLRVGDELRIGEAKVAVTAKLKTEPDAVSDRATFGPRVLVSMATLQSTGLIQPGTLIRWRYAVALDNGGSNPTPAGLHNLADDVKRDLPEAGFTIADRFDPSPQLTRTLERLRQFLTLIGLASLLVGGVGVANAVATFVDKRRKVIAIMKSLGAPRGLIFRVFLAQVLAVTAIGIGIGLALGAMVPVIVARAVGEVLPVELTFAVSAASLATAILYGLLVALLYALWPLGRAEHVSPSVLFRDDVAADRTCPGRPVIAATIAVAIALLAFTVLASDAKLVALSFCGGMAVVLGIFAGAGRLVPLLARRIPRARRPEVNLALRSIAAPGGLAGSVLLSLGIGLSLLIAIALVEASLEAELTGRLPETAPAYFVLDLAKSELAGFTALVNREIGGSTVQSAPMLRGRLVAIKGTPVESLKVAPDAAWVLSGDRGLTFDAGVPAGSTIVKGAWWPKDYSGEPLVSFEAELAGKLGIGLGDTVTVNVLGRNLTAKVASLREVKWDNLSLNFVIVFSPNALEAAPYKLLATIVLPKAASLDAEASLAKAMGQTYPSVTPVRVRDAIAQFNGVLAKVLTAVRVASGVTLLAGALVLAGALATAQRRRILDAVILKALGVTRARILLAHAIEYGLLALVAGVLATALGSLAAWISVDKVMTVPFVFSLFAVMQVLALAVALVAMFGGIGTWAMLRAPAVPFLKSE